MFEISFFGTEYPEAKESNSWQKTLVKDLSFLRWDPDNILKRFQTNASQLKFNGGVHLNSSELSIGFVFNCAHFIRGWCKWRDITVRGWF